MIIVQDLAMLDNEGVRCSLGSDGVHGMCEALQVVVHIRKASL